MELVPRFLRVARWRAAIGGDSRALRARFASHPSGRPHEAKQRRSIEFHYGQCLGWRLWVHFNGDLTVRIWCPEQQAV